ncbi:MAG: ABC transporter permease [Thermoanaerobaculaceae bacterium]|nr:ABC transporter permease [Thermoanaerobaculaceae bacterium]MDI9622879.1 ABC transporter permease [Acidobacteriota bacterium]NLH10933.1 ABC transporter permease [Holophagae bacterium]HPW54385.1 ABC transporter permease [Thermoanaerobaculaceae bacterium]
MNKVIAVLKREYLEVVRKKSFIIMTVLGPFLMAALMLLPMLLVTRGLEEKHVVVVDGTGQLAAVFSGANGEAKEASPEELSLKDASKLNERNQMAKALALRTEYVAASGDPRAAAQPYLDRMLGKQGKVKLDGVLVVGGDAFSNPDAELTYFSRAATDFVTQERLGGMVNRAVSRGRLAAKGIAADEADQILRRLKVEAIKLTRTGEEKRGGELGFLVAFVFVALLMIPNIIYGQEVMRGIVAEKSERVMEILISSMPSMSLLSGKILGLAAVGLTQVGIWMAMGSLLVIYAGTGLAMSGFDPTQFLSVGIIPAFFVFYVLGYLIYVCVYAVGGAISNSEKEAQQFMGPLIMVMMIPWFLAMPIISNPESTLATAISLIPVFTPITMFMRIVVSEPPFWQVLLSVGLSVATIVAMLWATAKIFRVGILSYGKRPTAVELWRWLKVA